MSELVSCRIKITHEDNQARDNKERGAKEQLRDEDEDEDPNCTRSLKTRASQDQGTWETVMPIDRSGGPLRLWKPESSSLAESKTILGENQVRSPNRNFYQCWAVIG